MADLETRIEKVEKSVELIFAKIHELGNRTDTQPQKYAFRRLVDERKGDIMFYGEDYWEEYWNEPRDALLAQMLAHVAKVSKSDNPAAAIDDLVAIILIAEVLEDKEIAHPSKEERYWVNRMYELTYPLIQQRLLDVAEVAAYYLEKILNDTRDVVGHQACKDEGCNHCVICGDAWPCDDAP